jgi:hypothetical protein
MMSQTETTLFAPAEVIVNADALRFILKHADLNNETFWLDDVGQPKGADGWDECKGMSATMVLAVKMLEQSLVEEFGQ